MSERLGDGVAFKAIDCLNGGIIEICEPSEKTLSDPDGVQTWPSFGFYEGAKCSTNANPSVIEETAAIALRKLERNFSYWVERGLWTGAPATAPIAANALAAQAVDDLGGPVGLITGFSRLVAALNAATGGNVGLIHGEQALVPFLSWYNLITRNGNILQVTGSDHIFVAGTGYTGTDPDGTAAAEGFSWLYATGAVKVVHSEIFIPTPAVDRSVNEIEVRAEAAAAAVFNPCAHIGIEVCLPDPGPDCGSA